jgi:hypothetical protein
MRSFACLVTSAKRRLVFRLICESSVAFVEDLKIADQTSKRYGHEKTLHSHRIRQLLNYSSIYLLLSSSLWFRNASKSVNRRVVRKRTDTSPLIRMAQSSSFIGEVNQLRTASLANHLWLCGRRGRQGSC